MAIIINKKLKLEKIKKNKNHLNITFDLFKSRPNYHKISAEKIISFKQHKKFFKNNPYRKWFLIKLQNKYIGTIYITYDNSIGYFILNKYLDFTKQIFLRLFKLIKPLKKKPSINQDYFTINISSKNIKYEKILYKLNGKIIQKTFIFK